MIRDDGLKLGGNGGSGCVRGCGESKCSIYWIIEIIVNM